MTPQVGRGSHLWPAEPATSTPPRPLCFPPVPLPLPFCPLMPCRAMDHSAQGTLVCTYAVPPTGASTLSTTHWAASNSAWSRTPRVLKSKPPASMHCVQTNSGAAESSFALRTWWMQNARWHHWHQTAAGARHRAAVHRGGRDPPMYEIGSKRKASPFLSAGRSESLSGKTCPRVSKSITGDSSSGSGITHFASVTGDPETRCDRLSTSAGRHVVTCG